MADPLVLCVIAPLLTCRSNSAPHTADRRPMLPGPSLCGADPYPKEVNMPDPIELTPMPLFLHRLIRTVDRLRDAGIEPTAVAIPVTIPGAETQAQPNRTIIGLPVLWLPFDETGHVFVVVD